MPRSDERFYLMEMKNRPAVFGDIGSLVRFEGVIVGGGAGQAVLMLPGYEFRLGSIVEHPNLQEWSDFIRRSDDPEILVGPKPELATVIIPNGTAVLPKIFHRKLRFEISGAVQQKVWMADGCECKYCGDQMGKALLTIDHFIPLELGGANDVSNYLTACKRCNKEKGSRDPEEFMATRHRWLGAPAERVAAVKRYLAERKI